MIPRRAKQKKNQSDMDQSSDKPKEVAAGSNKTDAAFTPETFSEGVLTRNRTSSITKSSAAPRPRTRSLSGSSQSDILTPESDKQSPGPASTMKRTSAPAKPDQLVIDNIAKGRRRRRTKAQIAADNAAKEALLELEKKETNLPVTKKPGRPRGRPKKVRTPVETPSSTVANSPTSSLQNEEPLPPLSTSNQESLESPTGDQETTKSSNESSYDFDAEQPSIDNVTTLAPTVSMTLLKKEELTFSEDTPLLKGDTTPSPVAETKTLQSCEDKDVVEEQSKEECEKVTAKTTEQQEEPSLQTVACPDNASTEDTVDGDSTEQVTEKPEEESIESMDISPCKATPAEVPSDEVPSEKKEQSSAGTPQPESTTMAAEEISSNFPTDNKEMMDTGSTAITTPVEETSIKICSAGCTTTTLTNDECTFADSFLTTCAVTAVTNTNTNSAISVPSSNASPSGTTDTLKSSTKAVLSATATAAVAPVVTTSSSATSTDTTANTSSSTTKAMTTSVSVDTPSSSSCTAVNSIDAKTTTPSTVSLDLPSAPMKTDNAKTVIPSSVSSSSVSTTTTSKNSTIPSSVSSSSVSTTTTSKNSTDGVTISTSAKTVSSDSIKSVAPSVVSLKESSTSVTDTSDAVTSTVASLTTSLSSSVPTTSSTNQSMSSVIPPASLNISTTAIGTTTVGNALSKISSQALLHSLSTTASSASVSSVAKHTVTSASADTTKDVAKLDPLPINLNTSLCVTLPTLSSLLTTPSGHQKLVLPLEKLVLPSNLETSAITTGAFISPPPPVSKPSHSCSYVITSMQMKDTDPVSLAVSTMAQITKENSLHSTASQKIMSTSHGPISSSMPLLLESKKPEPISVETKLREIAPKTLGLEFHHLTSDISRSSGVKKPELYEVLSNFKVAAVNRSLGGSELKSSSFGTSTVASIIGQNSGKDKLFDQSASGQTEQQHKPRPIAIKPDGMDILRQIPAAVATSSRGYPAVHPLLPLPATNKTANLMSSFDLFRNVPTTQKQYSAAPNISASVLPHLPGSSIAAYPAQKAPPPLISITDGPNQTVLGSVRVKVIDAPSSAHQSSLSSLPAHMKVTRPRQSQQSSVSPPIVTTSLVSVTGSAPALPTTYSNVSQQQYMPHPLTIGVHASSSNKAPSAADVIGASATASQPMSTTAVASVTKVKSEYEPAVTSHIPITSSVTDFKSSLECPMCRHPVKNYKALCGHMKMHGGWDKSKFSSLDDYVCLYRSSMAAKAQAQAQESAAHKRTHSSVAATSLTSDTALQPPPSKRHEGDPPQVFTFESNSKMSQEAMDRRFVNHSAATLDDLCKAAESMRKMGASAANQPDYLKRRPENIVIPSQYYGSGNPPGGESSHQRSPPYTPPPLLSPRPSIFTNTPLTPRSLYWPQRRSSEAPTVSESEESMTYSEPKINVGEEYQAELGDCDETKQGVDQDNDFSELVFKPLNNLSRDDEDILDGYFELACSPAVRLGGRNKEHAHHILHKLGGSVKEAVRVLLSGRSLVHKDSFMASYNYSGATKWSTKERQRFRRAWRDNHKDFRAIQKIVSSKDMRNVIEYYYTWKKYCMDEYKGRSRHYSMEEELSEDELETINGLTYDSYADRPSSSSTARASSDHHSYSEAGHSFTHPQIQSVLLTSSNSTKPSSDTSPRPDKPTFKCTYPGCTAAYSSIFALNGHIRIHGGSFYPPRGEKKEHVKTEEQLDGSGVPRDADAKSPRNQARSGSSPKRGQAGGFSSKAVPGTTSKAHKGKRISTTPHDQDGHYPCRLCGRVFDKVKSRSAHMKSHVVKPGGK